MRSLGAYLAILVVANLALGLIPAFIARGKGRSFAGYWVFGFFFFLIALIVSLVIDNRAAASPARVACPRCAEPIAAGALACRFCGTEFPAPIPGPAPRAAAGGNPGVAASWIAAALAAAVAGYAFWQSRTWDSRYWFTESGEHRWLPIAAVAVVAGALALAAGRKTPLVRAGGWTCLGVGGYFIFMEAAGRWREFGFLTTVGEVRTLATVALLAGAVACAAGSRMQPSGARADADASVRASAP